MNKVWKGQEHNKDTNIPVEMENGGKWGGNEKKHSRETKGTTGKRKLT